MRPLERKVADSVRRYGLLPPGSRALVGLSGGADSVCLLYALLSLREELSIDVCAAHLNHLLRGGEADRDEKFCRDLCAGKSFPFLADRADVAAVAAREKRGIEETARDLRYAFLERAADALECDRIAVAHHRDDNAETVLMSFLRASGFPSVTGIPRTNGRIVRPLLDCTRAEILAYLGDTPYVEDSSNADTSFARNRMRHETLPLLTREWNPSLSRLLCDHARYFSEIRDFFYDASDDAYRKTARPGPEADASALLALPVALRRETARRMLMESGARAGLAQTDAVLALLASGGSADVGGNVRARCERGALWMEKRAEPAKPFCVPLPIGGAARLPDGRRVRARRLTGLDADAAKRDLCRADGNVAYCDASRLRSETLAVTSRRNGDRFYPLGAPGEKKLKDFLIDRKLLRAERDALPIVRDGDEIVWVGGVRLSERYRVVEQTETILELTLENARRV